jgi:hypothetical protein
MTTLIGSKPAPLKTPAEEVRSFRERHGLDQETLDKLMGFHSGGRATRRWEAEGAPFYVTVLMTYADRYGLDVMRELTSRRDVGSRRKRPASRTECLEHS